MTDGDGEFTLAIGVPALPNKVVVVVHPSPEGWEVIDVQPWASVEVNLVYGGPGLV